MWAEGEATGTRWGAVLWEKKWRQRKCIRAQACHHHRAPAAPRGEKGDARAEAAITEDTEGRGVTTEDTGKEDI